MNFTMVHLFKYEDNYTNVASLYINKEGLRSNGATTILVPAVCLAFLPVTIAMAVDFAWFVLFSAVVGGLVYGARSLRRLSKTIKQHIDDVRRHNDVDR